MSELAAVTAQSKRPSLFLGRSAAQAARVAGRAERPLIHDEPGPWVATWRRFRMNHAAYASLCVMGVVVLSCLLVPALSPWSATEIDYDLLAATPPSSAHLLGTDTLGRDVLARLMSAGRISLLIGLAVAILSASAGAAVGTVQGYFGGAVDRRLGWVVDILMTIPSLPLLIALSSVASSEGSRAGALLKHVPAEWRIIVIMSLLGWMAISRVVRSQVVSLRRREFVEASIALGATHRRVMVVHILPNTISVIAVFTTLAVSAAIMGESALSFLGFGVALPTATWGNMLLDARDVFTAVQYWWLAWFPALMILVSVLCVNFIGDGLRDAFDPKARR